MKRFDLTTLEGNEASLNHGDSERVRLREKDMSEKSMTEFVPSWWCDTCVKDGGPCDYSCVGV